jgi:signal transduction histidine kinase/BarA-like signal transduction histidine kinase
MNSSNGPLEILHIEDSVDDAFFFRVQLRAIDLEIGRLHQVGNLAQALQLIAGGATPDLVFLDLSLPDAWGLEGLEAFHQAHPELIVVVLTGSGDESLPLRALQTGAQDYVSKDGLSAELLARVIRFALYRAESRKMLQAAIEEAKRANLAKSRFLANIGHELRTPLNVIMGFTDLFQAEAGSLPEGERREVLNDLRTVSEAQSHLLDLLNDLIDMAKIESDQFRLEPSDFSMHQLVENVHALFRDAFARNGNQFSYEVRGELPDLLYGDPRRIRQLLVNLLSNANKFTREGHIGLSVECKPAIDPSEDAYELMLEVSDTGIGISADQHQTIFEYFQQVDNSDTRSYEGSGLGLTICRQLAHMMGGEISVESDLGMGSTFTVCLKVAPADVETRAIGTPESGPGLLQLQHRKALVVEDESGSRRFVAQALRALGMDVTEAGSAEEAALSLVGDKNAFDFLIVDLHLPGKSGLDLVKAIKRTSTITPAPRVIVATGDRSEIIRERCAEEGIEYILFKPFAAEALCRQVIAAAS